MHRRALFPAGARTGADQIKLSPGLSTRALREVIIPDKMTSSSSRSQSPTKANIASSNRPASTFLTPPRA
jgi:hypothetical protein